MNRGPVNHGRVPGAGRPPVLQRMLWTPRTQRTQQKKKTARSRQTACCEFAVEQVQDRGSKVPHAAAFAQLKEASAL